MEFRTKITFDECPVKAGYSTPMLFVGSCFSDYIGKKLNDQKFPVLSNPFGVLYNPFSISLLIKKALNGSSITDSDIFEEEGVFKSFLFHSSFAHTSKDSFLAKANQALATTKEFLEKTNFIFLTLGTARYYKLNRTGEIVANCHKQPAHAFTSVLAETEECADEITSLIEEIRKVNPSVFIVFTISPVRHFKDGAFGNQVSKSTLFCAVNKLLSVTQNSYYFPSYELVMDELRDYRFYNEDMIHPSMQAVDYILEKFEEKILTPEAVRLSIRIKQIVSAAHHRPAFPDSKTYLNFAEKTRSEILCLTKEYPALDFSEELRLLKL